MSDSPVKDMPWDQPLPKWMVERMVTDAVTTAVSVYDGTVSKPRHEENIGKFRTLEAGQTEMQNMLLQIQGAVTVFKWLGGIVGTCAAVFTIIEVWSKLK